MKIFLSHPGVGSSAQQTARALLDANLLAGYWTTFADQPESLWRRLLVRLAKTGGFDLDMEMRRRAVTEVPRNLVTTKPFLEVCRSVLARIGADSRLVDAIWDLETFQFDQAVSRTAIAKADGVYAYEYSALASFREARRRGAACIYEVAAPEHDFIEGVIQRELDSFPELYDGKRAYFLARQSQRTRRRRDEWELADVVVANSKFTRDSYAAAGLDVTKVKVVPLGAPSVNIHGSAGGSELDEPLRVLSAGTFGIHKGSHYLLRAWRKLCWESQATLEIYGRVTLPKTLMIDLPRSIQVSPTVPKAALYERYHSADVLVFPTLCDGFGMVVTEAFAHGVPVITTSRAGAADLVLNGENGFIVPAGDEAALREALNWCLSNRKKLKDMRTSALETAARWQWSDYRRKLVNDLRDGLREAGYSS